MTIPSDCARVTIAYRDKFAPAGSRWYSASFDFTHNAPSTIDDSTLRSTLLSNLNPPVPGSFADVNLGVASMHLLAVVRGNGTKVGWYNFAVGAGFVNVVSKSGQVLVNNDYGADASSGALLTGNASLLVDKRVSPAVTYTAPSGRVSTRLQAGRIFVASPINTGISPYNGAVTRSVSQLITYGLPSGATPPIAWGGWAPCVITGPNATNSPLGRRIIDDCRLDNVITTQRDRVRKTERFAPLVP